MSDSLLIDRLCNAADPKVSVHLFTALTAEAARRGMTASQMIALVDVTGDVDNELGSAVMTPQEIVHWDWIITEAGAGRVARDLYDDVLMVAESGVYTPEEVIARLGLPL